MHVVSTEGAPEAERFGFWREVSAQTWVPDELRCEADLDRPFRARVNVCDLGTVQVALMAATPYSIHRTPKLVRQDDPGVWKLCVAVHGAGTIAQDDRETAFTAGDLFLCDTSRPYTAAFPADAPAGRLLVIRLARSSLPLPERELRRLTAVRIAGTHGMGALTSSFLLHLAQRMDELGQADVARLSTLTLDMLTAALAHELDAADAVPRRSRRRALLARIHAFIHGNLGDPGLSPTSIAAAHYISVRHLHNLFQEQEHTVVGWIRLCRLERCRRELADPLAADRPISEIAARWGFLSPPHFTRAFRSAYGVAPSQYRRQHTMRVDEECTQDKDPRTPRLEPMREGRLVPGVQIQTGP
ncbi:helix-turn-helix domain-containing protein [Spirillospora sp. NPDC047279]|uniref:AraC-like ligand-binding domain-containing protein n=1 Tax=Spirillospora sp. NPDC047279 TaxID=3155478 RepID=UPI0033DF5BDD